MLIQDMQCRLPDFGAKHQMPWEYVRQYFGIELDKCPFCFNPYPVIRMTGKYPQAHCNYCQCDGPISNYKEYEGVPNACAKWNNRTEPKRPSFDVK
jgi:hypothetical protein